ncbi:MAG: hypothetical protein DRN61_00730 [Thaumarchaeota archaeon]|nr:MAG: hypothetical protein DRN54_04650 [Nitrososphaerota archaeon]RLG05398.1 MAG: hypothetical protein DRN61_00730 [Nitrososphaerota archaeon]HDD43228.1 hypothetical protein [Nitrososphaeria archaeon]
MPLAAKIFEVRVETSLEELADKLRDYRVIEEREAEEQSFELLTEVKDLDLKDDRLEGVFSRDKLIMVNQRGKLVPILKTVDARMIFRKIGDLTLLTVVQEKHFANAVASILSHHLFLSYKAITEARISPSIMREFHERNPEGTKVIYFDDLDFVDVDKLALYGDSLKNTALYEEYLRHGKIWYIVFTVAGTNRVMGLTRNCVVTSFTKMPEPEFVEYIDEIVIPLIVRSREQGEED